MDKLEVISIDELLDREAADLWRAAREYLMQGEVLPQTAVLVTNELKLEHLLMLPRNNVEKEALAAALRRRVEETQALGLVIVVDALISAYNLDPADPEGSAAARGLPAPTDCLVVSRYTAARVWITAQPYRKEDGRILWQEAHECSGAENIPHDPFDPFPRPGQEAHRDLEELARAEGLVVAMVTATPGEPLDMTGARILTDAQVLEAERLARHLRDLARPPPDRKPWKA